MMRQVWKTPKAGSLNALRKVKEELSDPESGAAQIQVHAIGMNFADVFALQGLYSATPQGAFVPGLEFAGVVTKTGAQSSFITGDRVMGLTRFGAYATHLNVQTEYLQKIPANWSFAEGAAYLVQALTAWYALYELATLKKDQVVLVHSAAGGVGLHCLRILELAGAIAIGTVGHKTKQDFLKDRGMDPRHVIIRDKKHFSKDLKDALAHNGHSGFDIILDAVAGPYFRPGIKHLKPAGRYVIYGAADFMNKNKRPNYIRLAWQYLYRPRLDPVDMISLNHSLMAFNLIWLWEQHSLMNEMLSTMQAKGMLEKAPFVGHTYAFNDVMAALQFFQTGRSTGKIVIEVD